MSTSFSDLRAYLADMRRRELVSDIRGADWRLEIGALTEVVAFSAKPRALLFDGIAGYPDGYRVATNLFCTPLQQAIGLGLPDRLRGVELVQSWRQRAQTLTPIPPRVVADGPVRENVDRGDAVDLTKFPTPLWHEFDGGRFLGTGDLTVTRDPVEGWVNLGPYRCQIHDARTLGLAIAPNHHGRLMFEKFWAAGEDAPVAVVCGQDPHTYAAACMPLAWGEPEYDMAGALYGAPIEVIVDPQTGLPIPASAEIAVIGRVPPPEKELLDEGPFGECTGYYTSSGPNLVIHVDEVWHRNDPILQGNPTMRHSAFYHALGGEIFTSAAIWDSVEREVRDVVGVYSLYAPCQQGANIVAVSIKQRYSGHAKHAALAALASRAAISMNKAIVVVDDDVDPADLNEVIFAITTRCNPAEDVDVVRGINGGVLDPRIPSERRERGDMTTSTMLIDACRPFAMRFEYPRVNMVGRSLKAATLAKWGPLLGLD